MTVQSDGWHAVIPVAPVATPRPNFRHTDKGVVTFYPDKYNQFLDDVGAYVDEHELLDATFFDEMNRELGAIATIDFYVQAPKSQKRINKVTRTTAPDIDNLVKAILDALFRGLKIRDSRIVGLNAMKYSSMDNPRIEIGIKGIDAK
ncbi:RusA family crossover junction endodeoxyribonuclease [Lactiplantibacillus plantarum]|nr:RusA family crossover junction endodeoxyribonuclease [Lactiplantibacillus plantarum]MBS0937498.1 RusA family crossover junction endodeoxyribonuclease [Lactiplantibacillus plantarum]